MVRTLAAIYDREAFRPKEPIELEPNTNVVLTVRTVEKPEAGRKSFLETARSLNLEGLPDWSEKLED